MVRRVRIELEEVADLHNLAAAYRRAAKGKRARPDVQAFSDDLYDALSQLGAQIRTGTVPVGRMRRFEIFDPKRRVIHAPAFPERVLHHALMGKLGPVLDRALVADTFACRVGKGALAAVHRAQHHVRRFPWYVKVDIRAYFDSIPHDRLLGILTRRFKGRGVEELCSRILGAYEVTSQRGLPIGALTSQYFANTYLSMLDRYLLEELKVSAMVRYMDDVAAWCTSAAEARKVLAAIRAFVEERLDLRLHPRAYVQRSSHGLRFLGFRVLPGALLLSNRRRARFRAARRAWERAYLLGQIDSLSLQQGMSNALAIVAHADSCTFLANELARGPYIDA